MPREAPHLALPLVRVGVGLILATHGFSKAFLGYRQLLGEALAIWGLPLPGELAWAITALELGGGVLLAFGVLRRPIAALFMLEILVGILEVHGQHGWYTVGPGANGVEYSVLILVCLLAVILGGPDARARGSQAGRAGSLAAR